MISCTYKSFKDRNNELKNHKLVNPETRENKMIMVDLKSNICTIKFGSGLVKSYKIEDIVESIMNGMCYIKNPSALSHWKGFQKD